MYKISKEIASFLYAICFCSTFFIAVLLYWQYCSFVQEAQDLMQVKDAYYQHIDMLKRSLNESLYQQVEDEPDDEGDKKKNEESLSDLAQPELTIENVSVDFELINPEEEDLLSSIKKHRIKKFQNFKTTKKRKQVVTKSAHIVAQKNLGRYTPHRDFVFHWPIDLSKFWLSSLYGPRKLRNGTVSFHHAIDMAALKGTPVQAAAGGRVVLADFVLGYGNCILIEHNSRYKSRYAHLDTIQVSVGQVVQSGQTIGTVGDTGYVRKTGRDASHLHFEIYQDNQRINPLIFLFN